MPPADSFCHATIALKLRNAFWGKTDRKMTSEMTGPIRVTKLHWLLPSTLPTCNEKVTLPCNPLLSRKLLRLNNVFLDARYWIKRWTKGKIGMLLLCYSWAATEVTVLGTLLGQFMKLSFYTVSLMSNLEAITKAQMNFQMKLLRIFCVKNLWQIKVKEMLHKGLWLRDFVYLKPEYRTGSFWPNPPKYILILHAHSWFTDFKFITVDFILPISRG